MDMLGWMWLVLVVSFIGRCYESFRMERRVSKLEKREEYLSKDTWRKSDMIPPENVGSSRECYPRFSLKSDLQWLDKGGTPIADDSRFSDRLRVLESKVQQMDTDRPTDEEIKSQQKTLDTRLGELEGFVYNTTEGTLEYALGELEEKGTEKYCITRNGWRLDDGIDDMRSASLYNVGKQCYDAIYKVEKISDVEARNAKL